MESCKHKPLDFNVPSITLKQSVFQPWRESLQSKVLFSELNLGEKKTDGKRFVEGHAL